MYCTWWGHFPCRAGMIIIGEKTLHLSRTRQSLLPQPPSILLQSNHGSGLQKKSVWMLGHLNSSMLSPPTSPNFTNRSSECGTRIQHYHASWPSPPHFLEFCITGQRTPFQFLQKITQMATADGSPVTIQDCQLMVDWCVMASHTDAQPHTSLMAFTLEAAISTDKIFNKWLQRCLRNVLGMGDQPTLPAPVFVPPPGVPLQTNYTGPATSPPVPLPLPPNMWAQFAASLTQGLAVAVQPTASALAASAGGVSAVYEEGGRNYDKYQLAVVQGFSHTHTVAGIQQVWALFQSTKHADTHQNNIKRKMTRWADAQRPPVPID
jgi:hypothetical protein